MTARPKLIFTVDVEEDMPEWRITDPVTTTNIRSLPRLDRAVRALGVRPTYLVNYPVATFPESRAILAELAIHADTEIGTHLHPWNTPPYLGLPGFEGDERTTPYYMSALGPERFRAKLRELHGVLTELAGTPPVSFRAGRYGIDEATLAELLPLGYLVDTSVTPLSAHTADGGPDFRRAPQLPYRPSAADLCRPGDVPILEIPVSVALTRRVPRRLADAYVHLPAWTRVRGLLSRDHLGLIDFAWLYPVRFGVPEMKAAASRLVEMGSPVLNVFLHSSEVHPGVSGRIASAADVDACLARLDDLLRFCIDELGAEPATLAEAARALRPAHGLTPAKSA
ncbi:MAG: hypothetical protein WD226_04605 [Planctomycetota bacterium]